MNDRDRVDRVFIGCAQKNVVSLKLKNFLADRLNKKVAMVQEFDPGTTVFDTLDEHGQHCDFAIIVLTADDLTSDGELHPRQNVIHELGFFHGRIGRDRILLLKQDIAKLPSNVGGLHFLEFQGTDIKPILDDIRTKIENAPASELTYERLAANVYLSRDAPGAHVYSMLETFRSPEAFLEGLRNTQAERILLLGSAPAETQAFLGALLRLKIANEPETRERIHVRNVDHAEIPVKFVMSAVDHVPRHIVLAGPVGAKTHRGRDLADLNPDVYAVFKSSFQALWSRATSMQEHVTVEILRRYNEIPPRTHSLKDFVRRVLVPQETSNAFCSEYGESAFTQVCEYVGSLIQEQAPDHGARIRLSSGSPTSMQFSVPPLRSSLARLFSEPPVGNRRHVPFSVIFDLTYFCNLACKGCGVAVKPRASELTNVKWEISLEEAAAIIRGVECFGRGRNLKGNLRFCIGGGEPTLHPNFDDVIELAAQAFGPQSVSFDTNGTNLPYERLRRIARKVSNIGVGVDGDEDYHNQWRNPGNGGYPKSVFRAVEELLENAARDDWILQKIEIVFTPTAENWKKFKEVARLAKQYGIRRISCHRFMLTGRAFKGKEETDGEAEVSEPSPEEYLQLFEDIARVREEMGLEAHFHHSFEQLLERQLASIDSTVHTLAPCCSRRAALCISPDKRLHFCPWFVAPPFDKLGLSLSDFEARNLDGEIYYDICKAVGILRKYSMGWNVCPIAGASMRLPKREGKRWERRELLDALRRPDRCEDAILTALG